MYEKRFNQPGVACTSMDAINHSIRQTLNIPQETHIELPEIWFEVNREATTHAPSCGARADNSNYVPKNHYDSLVKIRETGEQIVREIAGESAVELYWDYVEKNSGPKIWIEYD